MNNTKKKNSPTKVFVVLGGIISFSLVVLLVLTYTNINKPSPPDSTIYLSDNINKWKEQFVVSPIESWELNNGKVFYFDSLGSIGRLTLYTEKIPSEKKKPNRITASVLTNGSFQDDNQDVYYGFELGNRNDSPKNKFVFGVNGAGQFIAKDGDGNELENITFHENVDRLKKLTELCSDQIKLHFSIRENPYGWIIFYSIIDENNEQCKIGNFINRIPSGRLKKGGWELSLVAKNSKNPSVVWFKNLEIQNDWVKND